MEISTSQLAVDLPGSGAFDPDSGVSAATAATGTQQQTQHTHHPRTPRQAPATETPAAEGPTKY